MVQSETDHVAHPDEAPSAVKSINMNLLQNMEPMPKPPKMLETEVGLVSGDINQIQSEANRLGNPKNS